MEVLLGSRTSTQDGKSGAKIKWGSMGEDQVRIKLKWGQMSEDQLRSNED